MKKEQKILGRYQQKVRAGLVPHRYDKDSKSFLMGAYKNWPRNSNDPDSLAVQRLVAIDRRYLEMAREAR